MHAAMACAASASRDSSSHAKHHVEAQRLAGLIADPEDRGLQSDVHDDFGVVLAATLTVLGLLIGFTFSMAVGRYDKRISAEEVEANAIGTAYVRADLLPRPKRQAFARCSLATSIIELRSM